MPKPVSINIGNMDFSFEHSLVKIIANRNCPEIKLAISISNNLYKRMFKAEIYVPNIH